LVISEQPNSSNVASGLIIQQANTHHVLDLFEEMRRNVKSPELVPKQPVDPPTQQQTLAEVNSSNLIVTKSPTLNSQAI
jgi:hypothetical protein